jgi:hypothetical protein
MIRGFALMMIVGGIAQAAAADVLLTSALTPRVFTRAQAQAGKIAYDQLRTVSPTESAGRTGAPGEFPEVNTLPENMVCTIDQNGEQVSPLVGPRFMAHRGGESTKEYAARVAMGAFPSKNVGGDTSLQLTAFFLQMNGGKPGKIRLDAETRVTLSAVTGQPVSGSAR